MPRLVIAALLSVLAISWAAAQETCDARAVSKDGKPLVGAAKTSFVNKCKVDACEVRAVGTNGNKLSGAARTSFMSRCKAEG